MSEGFSAAFRGVRPIDWFLAGALTALGIWLMLENVLVKDSGTASAIADEATIHQLSSHSWAMVRSSR